MQNGGCIVSPGTDQSECFSEYANFETWFRLLLQNRVVVQEEEVAPPLHPRIYARISSGFGLAGHVTMNLIGYSNEKTYPCKHI